MSFGDVRGSGQKRDHSAKIVRNLRSGKRQLEPQVSRDLKLLRALWVRVGLNSILLDYQLISARAQ